jgi:RNA recognition motif-containing protein
MDMKQLCQPEVVVLVAMFSLAWFLVGILVGRHLPARKSASRRARADRSPASSGDREPAELYVGNLSYDVDEKELHKVFSEYGKVQSVRLITNKFNGKSKGYGFVCMADRGGRDAAAKALNGKDLKGRRVVVNEAKSRPRD